MLSLRVKDLKQSRTVLLVEDNPSDVHFIRRSFQRCAPELNLHCLEDGDRALEFLLKKGNFTSAHSPDLLILDLNVPKTDGYEVLRIVRNESKLKLLPVIVLTTSSSVEDRERAQRLGANAYLTKPDSFEDYDKITSAIQSFWLEIACV